MSSASVAPRDSIEVDPEAYLADILERLPAMTNQDDLSVLLPSRWQPAAAAPASELTLSV